MADRAEETEQARDVNGSADTRTKASAWWCVSSFAFSAAVTDQLCSQDHPACASNSFAAGSGELTFNSRPAYFVFALLAGMTASTEVDLYGQVRERALRVNSKS